MEILENEWDCVLACERAGSADDGKYHKMNGDTMPTASVDRVEDIWCRALDLGTAFHLTKHNFTK